jgi:PAS domain S-box-containing protein
MTLRPIHPPVPGEQPPAGGPAGLHRLLVDRVLDYAIFALDPTGHILTWNSGAERLKQYRAEEIIGKHFSIFYPEADLAAGKPAWELEVALEEGQVEDEGWRIRKDGSRFWANVLITALRDDAGTHIGFAKVTRDLTERRAVEDALRRSEERFRLLVDSVRDYAIFMLETDGRIATWNRGAEVIKGYTADEIIGKHFSVFYTPEELLEGKPAREMELAIQNGSYEEEGWRVRKDGSRFWANVLLTAVRGPDGSLAGFAKVTRDLTERREAAELERRSMQAESANRAKSQFLAAMSHELRTPLNAIGGYAQLMQMGVSGPVTEEQLVNLRRIQRSQQHLLGIINDILNFSRIEAGQVAYDIQPVQLSAVADAVAPMVAVQADAKRVVLEYHRCEPGVVAAADRPKLEQVLLNLLSNAVKFTPEGGHISLSCGSADGTAWMAVKDDGIGIPADELESIFSPFVQVGRDLANPKEGTGLGLAISRDLARAMHGDLQVESEVGAGSTFTITLPSALALPPGA